MNATQASDSQRARVFLVGYYGAHNAGDEAIRHAIEAAAPMLGADVVHYATRDSSSVGSPRAVPVRGSGLQRYLRALAAADRVVLGGGGILKEKACASRSELFATALVARTWASRCRCSRWA